MGSEERLITNINLRRRREEMAVKKTSKAPKPKGSPAKKGGVAKKKATKDPLAPKSKSPKIKRGGSASDAVGQIIRIINGVKTPLSSEKKKK